MKTIVTNIIIIVSFFILTACTINNENTEKEPGTRLITHAMGQTNIPESPKRIVILTNEGTEALLALGVKPIGAVKSWTGNPWYTHIASQMEGTTVVGTESAVNLEAVATLQPDLIIGNKMRHEAIYDELSLIAPTVFSETLRGEWQSNFLFYSKAINNETRGNELINQYNDRITQIKSLAQSKNILDKEIAVLRFMPGKTRLYLTNTFSGIILGDIGFNRTLATDPSGQNFAAEIGKEELYNVTQTTDLLIYFTYETGNNEGTTRATEWLNDPLFKTIPAVKSGEIINVDDAIWNTAGGILAANLMLDDVIGIINRY